MSAFEIGGGCEMHRTCRAHQYCLGHCKSATISQTITDDMIRAACNAYGSSQSSCEFEWMREALTAALGKSRP